MNCEYHPPGREEQRFAAQDSREHVDAMPAGGRVSLGSGGLLLPGAPRTALIIA